MTILVTPNHLKIITSVKAFKRRKSIIVLETRRRRDVKIPLCLSARVRKSFNFNIA